MKLKCQNSDLEENKLDWASTCKMKKMEIFCFFILSITNGILRIFYGVTILCTSYFANMLQLKESKVKVMATIDWRLFLWLPLWQTNPKYTGLSVASYELFGWSYLNVVVKKIQSLCRILVNLLNISRTILLIYLT